MIRALSLFALGLGLVAGLVVVQLARDWRRVDALTDGDWRFT